MYNSFAPGARGRALFFFDRTQRGRTFESGYKDVLRRFKDIRAKTYFNADKRDFGKELRQFRRMQFRANESGGEDGGTRGPQIRMVSAAAVGYGGSSSASVGSGPQLQGQDVESMLKRTAATAAVAATPEAVMAAAARRQRAPVGRPVEEPAPAPVPAQGAAGGGAAGVWHKGMKCRAQFGATERGPACCRWYKGEVALVVRPPGARTPGQLPKA